jgi:hypothetical protein
MRRRDLIAALGLAAIATPALATEHSSGATQPSANYVDITPVGMPIVANGRLINYVFVTVRINFAPGVNVSALREKEPYFRDALVRLGHRTPFTRNDDYTRIDQARLRAALLPLATAIAGRGAIASIVVTSETPRQRAGLPRPPGAATAPAARPIIP